MIDRRMKVVAPVLALLAGVSLACAEPPDASSVAPPAAAPATQPAAKPARPAAQPLPAEGVEVTLKAGRNEYELGEPIIISVTYRNAGKEIYRVSEFHGRSCSFTATAKTGRLIPRAARGLEAFFDGLTIEHSLPPGGRVVVVQVLNDNCVPLDVPGTYLVTAHCSLYVGKEINFNNRDYRVTKSEPLELLLRDYDKQRRAREIKELTDAYKAGQALPERYVFDKGFGAGRHQIVRRLSFYHEPSLIPFFLDVMEDTDWNGYAKEGLCRMMDRDAVLRAYEQRLEHPEKHPTQKLLYQYLHLAVPFLPGEDKATGTRRKELERRYLKKAGLPVPEDAAPLVHPEAKPATQPAAAGTEPAKEATRLLADQVADRFAAHLASLKLSFLTDARLAALRNEVRDFVAKHEPVGMTTAEKDKFLAWVDRYLARQFRWRKDQSRASMEEWTYLSLPDKLRTFEWMLWVSLTRKPLTTEQAKVREEQHKWLREFLEEVPIWPGGVPVEGMKPEQVRPWALDQVEQQFSDPLSLLYDHMTERQFENFQRMMGYSAKNGLSNTTADIPVRALQARVQPRPNTADQTFDMPLPFDDKPVSIIGGTGSFVLFASNDWLHLKGHGLDGWLAYTTRDGRKAYHRAVFDVIGGTRIAVPAEIAGDVPDAPAVVQWLKQQGKGDLVYLDGPAKLQAVRGARLAVLSVRGWIEADKLSNAALRKQIAEQAETSISLESLPPMNGPLREDDPRIIVAIETAEKRLAVAILTHREFGLPFGCRARPVGGETAAGDNSTIADEKLLAAAKEVRAAHPSGGEALWNALARLVKPGMSVRQLKLVLPPHGPVVTLWNGQTFFLRYGLDERFGVEAGGYGRGEGEDGMILSDPPTIIRLPPATPPKETTAPAKDAATSPATQPAAGRQPTEKAAQRAEGLKKATKLSVELEYMGPEPKKTGLLLHSDTADYELAFPARTVQISPEQCRRIIDYLALEGFLDKADVHDMADPRPQGPTFLLRVRFGKGFYAENLGWNLGMLRRLDGLRRVLDGDAGEAMDKVIESLKPLRNPAVGGVRPRDRQPAGQWSAPVNGLQARLTLKRTADTDADGHEQPQPAWVDFQTLLGQPIDAPAVREFTARYGLKKYFKFDSGGFENYSERPFSLVYRRDRIERAIVQMSVHPSFSKAGVYTGELPHGVLARDAPEDVIRRMGTPTHQPERDHLHYDKEGLTFSFDRKMHRLSEVYLDATDRAIQPPTTAPGAANPPNGGRSGNSDRNGDGRIVEINDWNTYNGPTTIKPGKLAMGNGSAEKSGDNAGTSTEPNADQAKAIAEIEKVGGKVTVDDKSPARPVIEVDLACTKFTDAGLESLKGLRQLEFLDLLGTQVTDAGLQHLKGLARLQTLDLRGTKVTDAGMEHLKGLTKLRNLNLPNGVTKEGENRLKQVLPKCSVFRFRIRDLQKGSASVSPEVKKSDPVKQVQSDLVVTSAEQAQERVRLFEKQDLDRIYGKGKPHPPLASAEKPYSVTEKVFGKDSYYWFEFRKPFGPAGGGYIRVYSVDKRTGQVVQRGSESGR